MERLLQAAGVVGQFHNGPRLPPQQALALLLDARATDQILVTPVGRPTSVIRI